MDETNRTNNKGEILVGRAYFLPPLFLPPLATEAEQDTATVLLLPESECVGSALCGDLLWLPQRLSTIKNGIDYSLM